VACHATDPLVLAKVLTDFVKDNPQLQLIAGVVDAREVVSGEGIKALATLPGCRSCGRSSSGSCRRRRRRCCA